MRFGEPHWLWLLALSPLLAAFLIWALRRRSRDLARWCHPALWGRMLPDRDRLADWRKALLLVLAVLFLGLMAARPQLGSRILSLQRKGIDVVVALDCSESMLAEDLKPNRITRARQEIQSLIQRLRGDRVGLVAFAGEAFVQCPLTLDYAAARMFLRFMDTNLIPVPGTALAQAVRVATRAFDAKERKFKALVLITDGEDHEGNLEAAVRDAKDQGVRIFAVGIGTQNGEPIPERDATGKVKDYKRDRSGSVVMTRLDPSALQQICQETGGRYYDGNTGGMALDLLYSDISGMEQKEMKGGIVTQYEDRYGYFAGAALLLLALESILSERRRGRRAASRAGLLLLAALTIGLAVPAGAADPGTKEYRKGNYAAARDAYEEFTRTHPSDPRGDYNLGTALHQTGEMGPAGQALMRALRSQDPALRASAFYNLGNTRAKANDLKGASEAYEMALRLNPKDLDAKTNLELVRALMQQSPPDSSRQQQKQQDKQNDKKQDQKNQKDRQNQDQKKENEKNPQDQKQDPQQKPDEKQGQKPQQDQQQQAQQQQDQQQQDQQQKQQDQDQKQNAEDRQNREQAGADSTAGEPLKISPQQARQILDGLAQQEVSLQAERLRAKSRSLKVEKDW